MGCSYFLLRFHLVPGIRSPFIFVLRRKKTGTGGQKTWMDHRCSTLAMRVVMGYRPCLNTYVYSSNSLARGSRASYLFDRETPCSYCCAEKLFSTLLHCISTPRSSEYNRTERVNLVSNELSNLSTANKSCSPDKLAKWVHRD